MKAVKIDLKKLKAIVTNVQGKSGQVECICIPIEANHLFKGKEGVYLDLIIIETKAGQLLKQSLPKDVREKMSKEQLNAMPIIGDIKEFGKAKNDDGHLPGKYQDDRPF